MLGEGDDLTGVLDRVPRASAARPKVLPELKRNQPERLRLAILQTTDPFKPSDGRSVRTLAIARAMRRAGFEVRFEIAGATQDGLRLEDGFRVIGRPARNLWRNPLTCFQIRNDPDLILSVANDVPDLALVTDSRCAPTAMLLGALGCRVILDLPAVEEDLLRIGNEPVSRIMRLRPVERVAAREPEGILVASEADRRVFIRRHAAHPGRVVVFPNPAHEPPAIRVREEAPGTDIVWIGGTHIPGNVSALRRLERGIIPLLKRLRPGTPVVLVGKGTSQFAKATGVRAVERVDDLNSVFKTARCVVVPVTAGSGSRVKVVDAISRGIPVIGTAQGLAGHEDLKAAGMLFAESDSDIVQALIDLIDNGDLATELGAEGLKAYQERRKERDVMAPVVELCYRARRAWLDPEQKLECLRSLRGRWPESIEEIRPFLRSRPRRMLSWPFGS